MPACSRRGFVRILPALGLGLTLGARAQESVLLKETDSEALALNYKADATKVDKAKFPTYAAGQTCANCSLFSQEAGKPSGGCSLLYGKDVLAAGWCSSWEKKA